MSNYDLAYIFKAVDQMSEPLKKIIANMEKLDKQVKRSEGGFNRLRMSAAKAGKFLMASVVAPLAGAAIYALKNSEQLEAMQIKLEAVAGSAANAAKVMNSIKQISMSTGIAPEVLKDMATKLLATKTSMEDLPKKMQQMAMFAVVAKDKYSLVESALTRMRTTGGATTRTLVALSNAGIPIVKELNLSVTGMQKLTGKTIDMKIMEKALDNMTKKGSAFYESYKKMIMTMGSSSERVHNILRFISADLGDSLAQTFGIKNGMAGVADKLMAIEARIKPFLQAHPMLIKMVVYIGLIAAGLAVVSFLIAGIWFILGGALIVGVIYLYKKFEWFRNLVQGIYQDFVYIKDIVMAIVDAIPKIAHFLSKPITAPITIKQITEANTVTSASSINAANFNKTVDVNVNAPRSVALTQNNKVVGSVPMSAALGHSMGHV